MTGKTPPVKPGDMFLAVSCRACGEVILVAPIPPEDQDDSRPLAIFDEAQPVRCPHCKDVSVYQSGQAVIFLAAQSH